jgi:hypothetical protein
MALFRYPCRPHGQHHIPEMRTANPMRNGCPVTFAIHPFPGQQTYLVEDEPALGQFRMMSKCAFSGSATDLRHVQKSPYADKP